MATVYSIRVCPDCKGELPAQLTEFCPHCNTDTAYRREQRRKRAVGGDSYHYPESMFLEYEAKVKALEEAAKTNEDAMNRLDASKRVLRGELLLKYRSMPPEVARGVLLDALCLMKNVLYAGYFPEEIGVLIQQGRKIGKLAEATHSLFAEHADTP